MKMDPQRWTAIESLYQQALERHPDERSAWLQQVCAGDAVLLEEVESLLANADAHLSNPSARPEMARLWDRIAGNADIDSQAPSEAAVADSGITSTAAGITSAPPSFIGTYRILRLLGEGGMGIVYEAEQDHPRRTVALKVIKSGLTDPKLIRRFEQELLVLGRLQHPGIAQIYEAGTADNGFGPQPYFAMEFIRGQPLLEYAEAHQLTTRQRLELMACVCEAVHHAHQRGIIHRDLKPGNILVDETGQPKILDFGVARATDSDTRITHQTDLGQLVGTLAYMSPEQALADPIELDTRSDVYALGVVLYQMLAQRLPYKISSRLPEAVRAIQEDEPKPLSAVSSTYRGDIETIVGKALEKDKARRYSSAAELAADIHRHLHDEPIMARPASTIYQLQKFARRHKPLVLGIVAVFIVLIAGIIVSTREAARANKEAATSRAISDFLRNDLLAQASAANQARPNNTPDPDLKVRTALDRAAARIAGRFDKQPEVEAAIRDTMGQTYMDLGLYPEAQTQLERALELYRRLLGVKNPKTLTIMNSIGALAVLQGKYPEAEALLNQTLEIRRRVLGPEHPDTLKSMTVLAVDYGNQGKYAQAEALDSEALEIRRRVLGPQHPDTLKSMNNLAVDYLEQGKYAQAEALEIQTLDLLRRVFGPEHPYTLASMNAVANLYLAQRKYPQAEALFIQCMDIERRVLGPEHPSYLGTVSMAASMNQEEGKYALAETYAAQALAGQRHALGSESPETMTSAADLALAYQSQGEFARAEPLAREALEFNRKVQPDDWQRFRAESLLGAILAGQGRYAEAEPLLLEGYAGMLARKDTVAAPDRYHLDLAQNWVVQLYQAWGKPEKAAEWRKGLNASSVPSTTK